MTLKLFHTHYRIVDPNLGFAKCLDEGDSLLVVDTDDEGDFDAAIATERAKISKEHELTDEKGSPKVVFTNFSLLHTEDAIAISIEPTQVVHTFEGDRVVASVKPTQPKFL